jgi:hypothetical protein
VALKKIRKVIFLREYFVFCVWCLTAQNAVKTLSVKPNTQHLMNSTLYEFIIYIIFIHFINQNYATRPASGYWLLAVCLWLSQQQESSNQKPEAGK